MILSSPPQFGQCSKSSSNIRLSSFAQLSRNGRWCAQFASQSADGAACAGASARCGTTGARNLAFGAFAPRGLQLQHDLASGVGLYASAGQSRACDAAAQTGDFRLSWPFGKELESL